MPAIDLPAPGGVVPSTTVVQQIDVAGRSTPLDRWPAYCVGSDRAAIHLRPSHQRDLRTAATECGFQYLRCHGLFNDEMGIVAKGPDGRFTYDWTKVDAFIDHLLVIGVKPFIEVGDMPTILGTHDQSIFLWKWHHAPPASYNDWADFVGAFAVHITTRYGRDEVREWLFEVWNEPNLDGFWSGGMDGYFKLYQVTANALKAVDADYRVGGPATAGMGWIPELIAFCTENRVPLDFVAGHHYGCDEGFLDLDNTAGTRLQLVWTPDGITGGFRDAYNQIRASSRPELGLHVTEWGPSYSCRDPMHDSYICASWILEKLRDNAAHVESMSYWAFSDQFEEGGTDPRPFHGGFGLMNAQGLRKPAYFAYKLLNDLGDERLTVGSSDRVIATRTDQGARILAWDWSTRKQDKPNTGFFDRDQPSAISQRVTLNVTGLAHGAYRLVVTRVGYRSNDAQTLWIDQGRPQGTGPEPWLLDEGKPLDDLRRASAGLPEKDVWVTVDGPLTLNLDLRQNDVVLITLER